MTTAANIIDRSLQNLGQLESGATATVVEYADGLIALNAMLGSWNNEKLMCFALREESLTFTAAVSRTLGPTGNLVTARPVEIVQAWVVDSNTSIPVQILTDEEYGAIPDKTATGTYPFKANYKAAMPDGTIYFYPVPTASGTMKLLTRTPLAAFALIADTVTLPPGWDDALAFNLSVRWAPQFPGSLTQEVKQLARETKAAIKRMNTQPVKAYSGLASLLGHQRSNILTGL